MQTYLKKSTNLFAANLLARKKRKEKFEKKFGAKRFIPIFALPKQTTRLSKKGKDSVAQLVEQYTFNVWVLGSSPSGITKAA